MKRLVIILLGLSCLAIAGVGALESGAAFTYGSVSTVTASAGSAHSLLNLYSSTTDPDLDTGYAARAGYTPTTPAASGQDETMTVHLGAYNDTTSHDVSRVLKLKTPSVLPAGVTSINVALTRISDPGAGTRQPLTLAGMDVWNVSPTWTTSVTGWLPSVKRQLNLRVKFSSAWTKRQYIPKVRVVVKFTGFTTTYYQYDIPIKVNYGPSPGPD